MLTRLIVSSFHFIAECVLWLLLIVCLLAGYTHSDLPGMLGMFIVWLLFSVFIGGPTLLIWDRRERVKNIEQGDALSRRLPKHLI